MGPVILLKTHSQFKWVTSYCSMSLASLRIKYNSNLSNTEPHIFLFSYFSLFFWLSVHSHYSVTQIETNTSDLLVTAFSGTELLLLPLFNRIKENKVPSSPLLWFLLARFLSFGIPFVCIVLVVSWDIRDCLKYIEQSFTSGHSCTFKMKYKHYLY